MHREDLCKVFTEEVFNLGDQFEEFKLNHLVDSLESETLSKLLVQIHLQDKLFPDDLKRNEEMTIGDEKVKALIYKYYCHLKGIPAETNVPTKLPGILKSYWNKLKVWPPRFQLYQLYM